MIFAAGITVLIQHKIYKYTEEIRTLLVIPIVCAILTTYALLTFGNDSILSPTAWIFFSAFLFGIPIVIGGLLGYLFAWRKENHF